MHPPGPPMALGNMREQGVQHLIAFCLNDDRRDQVIINVSSAMTLALAVPALLVLAVCDHTLAWSAISARTEPGFTPVWPAPEPCSRTDFIASTALSMALCAELAGCPSLISNSTQTGTANLLISFSKRSTTPGRCEPNWESVTASVSKRLQADQ